MPFTVTPDDAVYMAFGTAAQGFFQYFMRKQDRAFPTFAAAAIVGGVGLSYGYRGLSKPTTRSLAAFAFGFGVSQIISYILPLLTGGSAATPQTAPYGVA